MALPIAHASPFPQNHPVTEIECQPSTDSFSAAASTSAAADLSSTNHNSYTIFINHRGPDVKKTFASHLWRRLLSHGFSAFLDQVELQEGLNFGSQIKGAIQNALVHVAIFSPRYAESRWCLDELLLMLESHAPIIPVFYNVNPAEVRWGKGEYGASLKLLEEKKRQDLTTIEKWRKALSSVADIGGFELDAYNGDEGELLDAVVKAVLEKLKHVTPVNVAKYPTGLDEKVKDLEMIVLSQKHSGKPQVVGIVGLGGIGKTTLAKEFFNRNRSNYSKSCFLFDIRENASRSSLRVLQIKLLNELTGMDCQIDSVQEGILMLRKHLSFGDVLIILDDVDHVSQMEVLFPVVQTVNSLILITSRDKHVLVSSGVLDSEIYKLTGINRQQSTELFCCHAFRQPYPLPGFEDLVEKFITVCNGIPLSLKVLGALLHGKHDIYYWEEQLKKLKKFIPIDIQERLKITYDALDEEEQQIFLDIACFFIGEEKDRAIRIWDGLGWEGFLGFQNLQNKCLVEVTSSNEIYMHDHLKLMGRRIADDTLPRRLENADELLQQQSHVITEVRGIKMLSDDGNSVMSGYKRFLNLATNLWSRLPITRYHGIAARNLQFLDVEGDMLERILKRVESPNLIWLRWRKCPYSFLPSWIPMKNIRVLQLRGNKLESLWQRISQTPLQLRELDIVSPLSKLPKSIGHLKHLERIVLKETNIKTLPDEFCDLRSLMRFELTNCSKLKSLPDSFGHLINLEYIDLSRSSHLQMLPNSFGNLIGLKYLNLSYCFNLTISSRALKNLGALECIDLSYCTKIEELPSQVVELRSLEKLYLKGTNLKDLPIEIGELSNLQVLELGSPLFHRLPRSLGDLRSLKE